MSKWEDVSTFSKNDKERKPKEFKKKVGSFTLTVHRHVHYPSDQWLLSCEPFFSCKALASKKVVEAMTQANALVQVNLEDALADILGR